MEENLDKKNEKIIESDEIETASAEIAQEYVQPEEPEGAALDYFSAVKKSFTVKKALTLFFSSVFFIFLTKFFINQLVYIIYEAAIAHTKLAEEIVNIAAYTLSLIIPFLIFYMVLKIPVLSSFKFKGTKLKGSLPLIIFSLGIGYLFQICITPVYYFISYPELETELPTNFLFGFLEILSIAVLPAIIEEWAFRGLFLKYLLPVNRGFAIVISALTFAFFHSEPIQMSFAFVLGLVLALTYINTGERLWVCIIIHFLNNLWSPVSQYLEKSEGLIFEIIYVSYPYVIALAGILLAIYYLMSGKPNLLRLCENQAGNIASGGYVAKYMLKNSMFYLALTALLSMAAFNTYYIYSQMS